MQEAIPTTTAERGLVLGLGWVRFSRTIMAGGFEEVARDCETGEEREWEEMEQN